MIRYFILTMIILSSAVFQSATAQTQTMEKEVLFQKTTMNYLLWLPAGYSKEQNKVYPLLIFLHGSGERGNNLELVKKHGPPSFVENRPDFPFITVSPQCSDGAHWAFKVEELQAMLEKLLTKYRIDTNRIYLTGLSMGGFGTWAWACSQPDQFAAIAPVCGGGYPYYTYELIKTPVWAFHGESDDVIPVMKTVEMVEAVNANGGSARMTIYPGVGHDSWVNAYKEEELYIWLLSHSKKK
jgi:predicted peptidase